MEAGTVMTLPPSSSPRVLQILQLALQLQRGYPRVCLLCVCCSSSTFVFVDLHCFRLQTFLLRRGAPHHSRLFFTFETLWLYCKRHRSCPAIPFPPFGRCSSAPEEYGWHSLGTVWAQCTKM